MQLRPGMVAGFPASGAALGQPVEIVVGPSSAEAPPRIAVAA
jgi:hypothetical protein